MESVVMRLRSYITYYKRSNFRDSELYDILPFRIVEINPGTSLPGSFYIEPLSVIDFKYADNDTAFTSQFNKEIVFPFGKAKIEAYPDIVSEYISEKIKVNIDSPKFTASNYLRNLSVFLQNKMGTIVALSFNSTKPAKAEDILNTLLDQYNKRSIEEKNQILDGTSLFISQRLELIKAELDEIDQRIEEYKKTNKTVGAVSESSIYIQSANLLEDKISTNDIQLELVNILYDFIKEPVNKRELLPYNIGLDNTVLNKQIQEYNDNLIKLNRMITASSERNPVVIDMTSMLESTRGTIETSVTDMKKSLTLQQKELEARSVRATGRIESLSVNERNVQSIAREQKIKSDLYLYLLNKSEECAITKSMTESNGIIVDYADGPNFPIAPRKMIILLMSFFMGLLIPGAYYLLKDILYNKVRGKADLLKIVSAPIVGEIPSKDKKETETIVVKSGSTTHISEAFRILRTNLSYLVKEPKVIAITSTQSMEGKTYISMNLAMTLALTGKRVCLLDLDLRRRSLTKCFSQKSATGVVDYLTGKKENIDSMIIKVNNDVDMNLFPAGPVPPNPAELLMTERFDQLIAELREKFDYIIVDNPPVDIVADTKISNRCADFTAYIVRAGVLDRNQLYAVEETYKSEALNNMGIILTDVDYEKLHYSLGYNGGNKTYGYSRYGGGKYNPYYR